MREVFASRICGRMESFVLGWRIGKGAGSAYSIYKACKWVLVGGEAVLQGLQGFEAMRGNGFASVARALGDVQGCFCKR